MLRAGSLFYALAITVIMALVSSSLLLSAFYTRTSLLRDRMREEAIRNARSGIEILLNENSNSKYDVPKEVDLFERGADSVCLSTKAWGAFEIAISYSHNLFSAHELIAATGWKSNKVDATALYLADLDRPLSITGNTKLTGTCYLPKAGIQRAYIEGQNYSGDKLVYGETKTSDRFIPKYNDTLVKRIKQLFDFVPGENDSVFYFESFAQSDSISNSFRNSPLYIFNEAAITITQKISGQICIISRKIIRVQKSSSLHNVLLIAPKIEIEDETEGDFQAFARDSLVVGKKVVLHYPTVLGIIATERSPDLAAMQIGERTKISGQIFGCTPGTDSRKQVLIATANESVICGEIYTTGLVDHKGTVYGNIVCTKFELKTSSAEYENHLMNAVIDRPKRSPEYVSSALTRKSTDSKAIVQWLN
jgi:hypothetical protein